MKQMIILSIILLSSLTVPLLAHDEGFTTQITVALEQPAPIAYAVSINNTDLVKFLIDNNEDVNLATPAIPAFWVSDWTEPDIRVADQPGKTPLDIAIESQNREMVEILLYYHPTNRANHDYTVSRHYGSYNLYGYFQTWYKGDYDYSTTPLSEAIKRENAEIVDLLLKAFQSPLRMHDYLNEIRMSKRPELMRSWIAQTMLLWKNEVVDIPEEVVSLYMYGSARKVLKNLSTEKFLTIVRYGAIVNKLCFQDVVATQNEFLISFVLSEARLARNFNAADIL